MGSVMEELSRLAQPRGGEGTYGSPVGPVVGAFGRLHPDTTGIDCTD